MERYRIIRGEGYNGCIPIIIYWVQVRKDKRISSDTNEVSIVLNGKPIMKNKVVIEPDCYYEQALNEKNFRKRLKRIGLI